MSILRTAVDGDVSSPAARSRDVDRRPLLRAAAVASVLAIVVLAQAGLVLAPSQLDERPLLVLAIRPTPAFLVLVTNLVPPPAAVLIAAVSRTLVDVAYFAVARYGALPLAQRLGVGRNVSRCLSGRPATRNMLAVTFFWSSTPIVAALGLGSTSLLTFLAVTGTGNLATSGAFVMLGREHSEYVAPVTAWVSAHGVQLTIALGAIVAVSAVLTVRRRPRSPIGLERTQGPADTDPALLPRVEEVTGGGPAARTAGAGSRRVGAGREGRRGAGPARRTRHRSRPNADQEPAHRSPVG